MSMSSMSECVCDVSVYIYVCKVISEVSAGEEGVEGSLSD